MKAKSEATREILLRYFELIGARVQEAAPGVVRVELTREEANELEGGANLFWLHPAEAERLQAYYFTFSADAAERYGDVELVSPGSHRARQAIQAIRRRARATRMWLPGGDGPVYRPFYLFLLRLDYLGVRPFRRLLRVAVDRVDELPLRQLAEMVVRLPLRAGMPPGPLEEARIGFDASFGLAFAEAIAFLQESDPGWADETWAAIEGERERLVAFYEERAHDGDDVRAERAHRLAELDAMRPRVLVRLQGVAEAYLPVVVRDGTVRHLAFEAQAAPAPALQPSRPSSTPRPSFR